MKYIVCSIFDTGVEAYTRPFFVPHVGMASRSFADEVNNPQGDFFKHPADYILYELGEYDDQDASFALLKTPRMVTRGQDVFRPSKDS